MTAEGEHVNCQVYTGPLCNIMTLANLCEAAQDDDQKVQPSMIEEQCLAIVFACEHFNQYPFGRDKVMGVPDHKPTSKHLSQIASNFSEVHAKELLNLQGDHLEGKDKKDEQMFNEVLPGSTQQTLDLTVKNLAQVKQTTQCDAALYVLWDVVIRGWLDTIKVALVTKTCPTPVVNLVDGTFTSARGEFPMWEDDTAGMLLMEWKCEIPDLPGKEHHHVNGQASIETLLQNGQCLQKKRTIVKKKKKKVTKKEPQKTSVTNINPKTNPPDSLKADFAPPPPVLREKMLAFLQDWKAEQQEIVRGKLSDKIDQELTAQDIRDLRLVFDTTDTSNTGYLSTNEVYAALRTLGFSVSHQELRNTLRNLGESKEEKVSFADFLEIVVERQGDARDTCEEIKQGFSLFDCDGDGKITFDNLKAACKSAGVHFSHQDLREMIKEVDTNGDGTVDMEEFINLMLQTNLF
ncbi:uncharacterized protein LOC119951036 [Scyliorhinus canicula]|uniref:uncharacterized protein LOC119951036 n=1 Tax=Scyliorhinus canicula TaxID=7830 RepID=UPI0018F79C6B|nr:uncharacterized protein LOC119951036 [Scyliorhinus canicula]